jgi:TrwC relaxase
MTMSIRRMSLGAGYRYLMSSVARADGSGHAASALTRYYAESGTPPGRFLGRGLAGLDDGNGVLVGSALSEEHLYRMLGMLQVPISGAQPGRPPATWPQGIRRLPRGDPEGAVPGGRLRPDLQRPKVRQRGLGGRRRGDSGADLRGTPGRARARHRLRGGAGVLLPLGFGRGGPGGHRRGGRGGLRPLGLPGGGPAAAHPRRGDEPGPNRRRGMADAGLPGRVPLRRGPVRDVQRGPLGLPHSALGWGWEACGRRHSNVPKYEVAGVPELLREEFSSRTTDIEAAKDVLVAAFVASHGRQPAAREVLKLRQQATLSTRPDKHVHPLADLVQGWRGRAQDVLGADPVAWVETLAGRNDLPLLRASDLAQEMLAEAANVAVHTVAEKRATFARSNIFAEVLRQFHGVRLASADDRIAVVERTTELAVGQALLISAPELAHTPRAFQRADGTSRFRPRGCEI